MKTKTIGIIAMTALFIGCPDLMQAQHEEKSNANQRIEKNNLRENFRIKRDGDYGWFTKNKRNESGEEKRQFTRKLMTTRGVIKNLTNENRNSLMVAVAIGGLAAGTGFALVWSLLYFRMVPARTNSAQKLRRNSAPISTKIPCGLTLITR